MLAYVGFFYSNCIFGPPSGTHRSYSAAMLQIPSFSPKITKNTSIL